MCSVNPEHIDNSHQFHHQPKPKPSRQTSDTPSLRAPTAEPNKQTGEALPPFSLPDKKNKEKKKCGVGPARLQLQQMTAAKRSMES